METGPKTYGIRFLFFSVLFYLENGVIAHAEWTCP